MVSPRDLATTTVWFEVTLVMTKVSTRLMTVTAIVVVGLGMFVGLTSAAAQSLSDDFIDRITGQAPARTTPAAAPVASGSNDKPPPEHAGPITGPPTTPPGMPACVSPMAPASELPHVVGETVRYAVDVNGLSVGTIDFRVERRGAVDDTQVTEYRSLFKIDDLVATLLPIEGRAASLVADATFWPMQAMSRYKIRQDEFDEKQNFAAGGRKASSHRVKNGKAADDSRIFPGPAQDFVSGFYLLRSIAPGAKGCAILYGSHRAYTAWIKPDGDEQVMTPVGLRPARRYAISFASDKAKTVAEAKLWISTSPEHLPYKAELLTGTHIEARIHLYEDGKN